MLSTEIDVHHHRRADHPIDDLFLRRWSPRAMSGEALTEEELATLFEAARWAPSSGNGQPWRFLYAHRDSASWPTFFDLLNPGNRTWAARAAVLVVVVSRTTFERNDRPARTHSFDTGAAWMALALQARLAGLVAHGMAGFDYELARQELGVPDDHAVEAMIALGRPGHREDLPPDLADREQPNGRKPVTEIAFPGRFPRFSDGPVSPKP
jgi:nitroreductase